MGVLALDLSKSSTGFAYFKRGGTRAEYGSWKLGSEYTSNGGVFAKLHQNLSEIRQVMPFTSIYYEEKIDANRLRGNTNAQTISLAAGLVAHTQSFAHALNCQAVAVNISSWRGPFIGKQPRGTKSTTLKDLTIERCRQLGFKPRNDDEADALGILTYALDFHENVHAPWVAGESLRLPLGMKR